MKKTIVALAIALPATVFAGGFERSDQAPNYLFNDGRYVEFSLSLANPSVSGEVALGPTTQKSGDIASNYRSIGFAYKAQINDKMDWSLAYSEPYGADVFYRNSDPLYPFTGSWAELEVKNLTALLKYKIGSASVYGGPRISEFDADANVVITVPNPANQAPLSVLNYKGNSEKDQAVGYVLGAAYEKKEIGLRVALTYNSEVEHESSVVESATGINAAGPFAIPDTASTVETTLPQAVTLSFQTGLNKKTLLFGSVHWADWTESEIAPGVYSTVTGGAKLVSHDDDSTTYKLGIGRRLNDAMSLAVILGHEKSTGEISPNLAPTDGYDSITFAGIFNHGKAKLTAGVSLIEVGDTYTSAAALGEGTETDFSSNKGVGFGVTYGYTF